MSESVTTKPKYMNRGTYGCIYQPMIPCDNTIRAKLVADQYISKISKKTESEERIGTILRRIPHYQYYFAPIISSCPLHLGEIDEREIKKCEIIATDTKDMKDMKDTYQSYKIRYVG